MQEIDVVEQYAVGGASTRASHAVANLHPFSGTRKAPGGCQKAEYTRPQRTDTTGDYTSEWTTFVVDWTETWIAMRVNGVAYAVYDQSPGALSDFTDPLFLALTACVMERTPPTSHDDFPLEYLIDWVRVYEWA